MARKILVVEDRPAVLDAVGQALSREGFNVEAVSDGEAALGCLRDSGPFDLALVGVALPGMDGVALCRGLRAWDGAHAAVPVVMLGPRYDEASVVAGLDAGADDYVTEPFSQKELVSRVRAHLRRRFMNDRVFEGELLEFPGLLIDLSGRRVLVREESVALTLKEFEILTYLASRPGQVCSREQISHHLWKGKEETRGSRAVDVHIQHIRKKIESDPENPRYIRTVRGIGYMFAER